VSEVLGKRFVVGSVGVVGSVLIRSKVVTNAGWVPVILVVPGMVPPRATVAGLNVVGTESGSLLFWTFLALASWGFGLDFDTSSSKVATNVGCVPVTLVVPGMVPQRHHTVLVPRLMTPDPCGPWPIVGIPAPLTFSQWTSTVLFPVLKVLVVVLIVLVVPVVNSPLCHPVPVRVAVLEMVPPVVGMVLVRPWLLVPGV